MDKSQAQSSIGKINSELFKLDPDSLIELFEVDFSSLVDYISEEDISTTAYRFHSNLKFAPVDLIWNNQTYFAIPIRADGFEISTKGTVPTPKLSLFVPDEGSSTFTLFKKALRRLNNDLTNARVTRIKTFVKHLDLVNFPDINLRPLDLDPDPYAELARDVYFIDRKTYEDKNYIEFELTSIENVEGYLLPGRTVFANSCTATYRGNGCCYEYNDPGNAFFQRKNNDIHGIDATLPAAAPSVATENDELIIGQILPSSTTLIDKGEYNLNLEYQQGWQTFITKNNINYYFVAKTTVPMGIAPPNQNYWIADKCSKRIYGCRLRWELINNGVLPFNGFPGVNKVQ